MLLIKPTSKHTVSHSSFFSARDLIRSKFAFCHQDIQASCALQCGEPRAVSKYRHRSGAVYFALPSAILNGMDVEARSRWSATASFGGSFSISGLHQTMN